MRYLIIYIIVNTPFIGYLYYSSNTSNFKISILKSMSFLPQSIIDKITVNELSAIIYATGIITAFSLGTSWTVYLLLRAYLKTRWSTHDIHNPSRPAPNPNGLIVNDEVADLTVVFDIPEGGIPEVAVKLFPSSREVYEIGVELKEENKRRHARMDNPELGALVFTNVMPRSFVRVDRQPMQSTTSNIKKDPLTELYKAGIEMLSKHGNWPAAVSQHHAGALLLDHSIQASKNMYTHSDGHKCSLVIGLYHDIGKLLTYQPIKQTKKRKSFLERLAHRIITMFKDEQEEVMFNRLSKKHTSFSVYILKNTPEFKSLSKKDAQLIEDVILYGQAKSQPERLKKHKEFNLLARCLSYSDGTAVRNEIIEAQDRVANGDMFSDLIKVIWETINSININDFKGLGISAGFTNKNHDVVMIPFSNFITEMREHATIEMSTSLMLEIENTTYINKELSAVLKALDHLEVLRDEYHGIKSETGLFIFRSGRIPFINSILLDKKAILSKNAKLEFEWAESKYPLSVISESENS
jgi:hypothetical protein